MMDFLEKPKSPCAKDCPYRDTYCRIDCDDYKEYEEKYKEYYEQKSKKRRSQGVIWEYIKEVDTQVKRRRKRHG